MAKVKTYTVYLDRNCYIHYEYKIIEHFWSGKVEYSHCIWMYNSPYSIPHNIAPQSDVMNWHCFFEFFLNRKWTYNASSYRDTFRRYKHIIDEINGFKFYGCSYLGHDITLWTSSSNYTNGELYAVTLGHPGGTFERYKDWTLRKSIEGKDKSIEITLSWYYGESLADLISMAFNYNLHKQRNEKYFYLDLDESIIDTAIKCKHINDE